MHRARTPARRTGTRTAPGTGTRTAPGTETRTAPGTETRTAPGTECRLSQPQADKSDTRRDVLVARRAAEQWGVLSLDELGACGLSRENVRVRVANGHLHRLHAGVYAVGHPNVGLEGRFLAAVKACGDGALLSHYSAGALWGFLLWDDRWPEVTVLGTSTHAHAGLRVHRTRVLAPQDLGRHAGIDLTSPARTLLDLAAIVRYEQLRRAIRQAQSLYRVNLRQLLEVLARLGPRRGTRNFARIVATGPAPTRSELEDAVLDLALRGGLAHPIVNGKLVLDGRRIYPDLCWPEQMLVVEADGAAWHDNKLAREDDADRQALLETHGFRVLRVTWDHAILRPAQTLARIRAAGAPSVE